MAGSRHIRLEALIPGSVLAKTLPSDSGSGSPGSGSDNTTGQQHAARYRNEAAAGLAISQLLGSSSTAEAIDQAQSNVFLRYSTLLAAATTDGASGGSSAGQWPSATSSAMRSSPEGSNSDGAGSSARQAPRSKGVLLTLWRGDAGAIRSDTGSTTDNTPPEHGSGDEAADWFARFRRGALTGVGAAAGAASAGGGPASAGSHRIQEALNKTYLGAHGSRQQQGGCADSKIMPQGAAADEGTPSQVPWYWGAASNVGTAVLAVAVVVVCGAAVLAAAHQPEQQQQQQQQGRQSRHDRLRL